MRGRLVGLLRRSLRSHEIARPACAILRRLLEVERSQLMLKRVTWGVTGDRRLDQPRRPRRSRPTTTRMPSDASPRASPATSAPPATS